MTAFDEMHGNCSGDGVREPYRSVHQWLEAQEIADLIAKRGEAEALFRRTAENESFVLEDNTRAGAEREKPSTSASPCSSRARSSRTGPPAARRAPRIEQSRPFVGPDVERQQQLEQLPAVRSEPVSLRPVLDDGGLAQLAEPGVENAGVGLGGLLQGAEGEATIAQLPQDAKGHAAAEQVEQRHHRPAGGRAAYAPAGKGSCHAMISVAHGGLPC